MSLSWCTLRVGSLSSLDTGLPKDDPLRCSTTSWEVMHYHGDQKNHTNTYILALVLAPFFVHMEILFKLGYRPAMFRQLQNDVGVEIAKFRKIEGDKKRAAERRTE
jgi:hypothetical protein